MKKSIILIAIVVMALLVSPAYAGADVIISSFTGSCSGASVNYLASSEATVTIINVGSGATLHSASGLGTSGPYSTSFSPELESGTTIRVTVEGGTAPASATVTVFCTEEAQEEERYLQMCNDGRANVNLCEPVAIYPMETEDGIGFTIWDARRGGSVGQLVYVSAEEFSGLPDTRCLVRTAADGFINVVWLGDELVIFAGPDDENKTFIFFFESFPGTPRTETFSGDLNITLPACSA